MPPYHTIHWLHTQEGCDHFVRYGDDDNAALVNIDLDCTDCNQPMLGWAGTCRRCNHCGKKKSVFKHTFFGKVKIPRWIVMNMAYDWLNGMSHTQMMNKYRKSSSTVTNWIRFFQQLVTADMENLPENVEKIGGEGVVVEIDEAKFGKRMFNQGHMVRGVWVVGGVERTPERRFHCQH